MPRKVTLTFDNGPTPEVTSYVLDCLARNEVKVTFFVIGSKAASAEGSPLAQRASNEGHYIGNHTFTHTTPLGELGRVAALREFEQAEKTLSWLRQPRRLFRPYARAGTLGRHLLHPAVMEKLLTGGYWCVLWNCVPGDWRDPERWVERAIADCRTRLGAWWCFMICRPALWRTWIVSFALFRTMASTWPKTIHRNAFPSRMARSCCRWISLSPKKLFD